jgi:chromosomal replication initiator protein
MPVGVLDSEGTVLAAKTVEEVFSQIVERTKALDPANARKWFDELAPARFNGGLLLVACPDTATVEFLRDNCSSSFTRAAQQVTGHLVTVDFECLPAESFAKKAQRTDGRLKLHPDYTFSNFVVGPSNRLAHASCVAVSQSPGNTYNPLFLYGNSGLGKTHLLHAVCKESSDKNGKMVIQLLSCEDFVNRFIRAIEQGNLAGFQSQFRSVDMLVIDDIQFLSEREQSQEEFFHTFNTLYHNSKQIILSADSPPAEIPSLEERLISRFNWGLVTRIDPPSHDTRVAIVQKKAHLRGLDISEPVADYIARKAQSNIRELEGALTAIYAVATTTGSEITLELAQTALNGQLESAARHISISDIIDVVTDHFDVRLADLQSKKRSQSITLPRQICMYLARNLTRHSLEEIGGHLGGRDHTTVMHACGKVDNLKNADPKMNATLADLERRITQPSKV